MNTIASKHRAGWRGGKTIINEVGGKGSYIWMISDTGETGIKGYIGGVGDIHEGPHWDIKYVGFIGITDASSCVGDTEMVGAVG